MIRVCKMVCACVCWGGRSPVVYCVCVVCARRVTNIAEAQEECCVEKGSVKRCEMRGGECRCASARRSACEILNTEVWRS